MGRDLFAFSRAPSWRRVAGRVLLVILTLWALAMVAPDVLRLARPLGSLGFSVDGDGLVTDVRGPFPSEDASPAWQAGLRPGDRLDLAQMRCNPVATLRCATALATLGRLPFVTVGRRAELVLAAKQDSRPGAIELVARATPFSWWAAAILALDQIAAIVVILAAAWLVWTRPGQMTWGFFLYIIWFNPGQSHGYYALLQAAPAALLVQMLAGGLAQGVGLAGFLLFALRAPGGETAPRWRKVEKALPAVAALLALLLVSATANAFGFRTELLIRAGAFSGFAVAACALAILLARRRDQPPIAFQRLRWAIWGCVIGLPSLALADIGQQTSLLDGVWGHTPPPDELWEALRLINGLLCLFVFEAVRNPLVVSVGIPLRRVTILGLLLSAPALFAHEHYNHLSHQFQQSLPLPGWVWLAIATFVLFLISRLHEFATHQADRLFNRATLRAARQLGDQILDAQNFAMIEAPLAAGVLASFRLASASIFARDGAIFRQGHRAGGGTPQGDLAPDDPILRCAQTCHPIDVAHAASAPLEQPVFAVPVANRFDCFAIALYGPHASGANLNEDERAALAKLGRLAGDVWAKLDRESLLRRVEALQSDYESLLRPVETLQVDLAAIAAKLSAAGAPDRN